LLYIQGPLIDHFNAKIEISRTETPFSSTLLLVSVKWNTESYV